MPLTKHLLDSQLGNHVSLQAAIKSIQPVHFLQLARTRVRRAFKVAAQAIAAIDISKRKIRKGAYTHTPPNNAFARLDTARYIRKGGLQLDVQPFASGWPSSAKGVA